MYREPCLIYHWVVNIYNYGCQPVASVLQNHVEWMPDSYLNSGRTRILTFLGLQWGLAIMWVKWLTWYLHSVNTPYKCWLASLSYKEGTAWGKVNKPSGLLLPLVWNLSEFRHLRHIPECVKTLKRNKRGRTRQEWIPFGSPAQIVILWWIS